MIWDKQRILEKLRQLNKAGKDLSYNALARSLQPLVSAAAYHFGSYRKAVEKAGIDYADVSRRPRWTKPRIIQLIKQAYRNDEDLHWSAVTKRRDELGKAAFASLQPRLFGRWDRALHAAGLDAAEVSRYRKWDRNAVVFEIKEMSQAGDPLNSGAIQQEDPGLHAAAVRHFGSYDNALRAAKIDPSSVRRRQLWTRESVAKALRSLGQLGDNTAGSAVRQQYPALYSAAVRLYGSFADARQAARVKSGKKTTSAGKSSRKPTRAAARR
jgi:hypothetical protein